MWEVQLRRHQTKRRISLFLYIFFFNPNSLLLISLCLVEKLLYENWFDVYFLIIQFYIIFEWIKIKIKIMFIVLFVLSSLVTLCFMGKRVTLMREFLLLSFISLFLLASFQIKIFSFLFIFYFRFLMILFNFLFFFD
jgi:hypothetical protein